MAADAIFNLFEAALWFAISAVLLFLGVFGRLRSQRGETLLLAGAFAAFGASDLIEARTGAWWDPWWLFALKTACVLVFLRAFLRHRARKMKR